MSKTYQRSSYREGTDQPEPPSYMTASLKPLSPEQFAWTMLQTLGEVQKQKAVAIVALVKADKEFDAATPAGQALHDRHELLLPVGSHHLPANAKSV